MLDSHASVHNKVVDPAALSDWELLKAYTAGDAGAFSEIVRRHGGLVYSAALRRTRDVHLAEDITQAVFLLLSKKARPMRASVVLPAWLYRAARYAAKDAMKQQKRRRFHEKRAAIAPDQAAATSEPREPWQEMAPLLDDAMDSLREKDRTAILLRFFQGHSLREVGSQMGVSEAVAGVRVSRAIERLRQFFAARGPALPAAALELMIARYAVGPLPAGMTISTASSASALSPNITSIAKGAGKMFFWSNMKIATVVVSVALLAISVRAIVLEAQAKAESQATASAAPSNQPYQQPIPGGGTFQLCLADVDVGGKRMWNPDGRLLEPPPFDLVIEKRVQEAQPKKGEWRIAAMMRVVDANGRKVPGSFSAGRGVFSFGVGGATVEKDGKPLDGWEIEMATVDARQASFVLQTGWAIGPWTRLATWGSNGFPSKLLTDDRAWQIEPGMPNDLESQLLVPIALQFPHLTDWDERCFAVLANGTRVQASTIQGMRLMNGVGITAFSFFRDKAIKRQDVKSYELEVRGLTRIIMKNLPPSPSAYHKPDIEIAPPYPLPKMKQ